MIRWALTQRLPGGGFPASIKNASRSFEVPGGVLVELELTDADWEALETDPLVLLLPGLETPIANLALILQSRLLALEPTIDVASDRVIHALRKIRAKMGLTFQEIRIESNS